MKKFLLLGTVLVATTAFAFGGGGGGRKSTSFTSGVDAIGVHYNGQGQADIITCADDEEIIGDKCLKKCDEGLERNTDGTCTVCTNGNVYLSYNEGAECDTPAPDNMGCKKNGDCSSSEYCKITGAWQNCSVIAGGTCETLDEGRETTYENGTDKKKFLVSLSAMSWWAAENWCKAHHKSLVSYDTLNRLFDCNITPGQEPLCDFSKFTTDSYWSNGTLSDYYWTTENYDSCYVFCIHSGYRWFYYDYRGDGNRALIALCE